MFNCLFGIVYSESLIHSVKKLYLNLVYMSFLSMNQSNVITLSQWFVVFARKKHKLYFF